MGDLQQHDLTLTDGTTTLGLMLKKDGNQPSFVVRDIPPLPPRNPTGAASYSDKPAEIDLTWVLDDWSKGFGEYLQKGDPSGKYAYATGWETRWPNVLTMGAAMAAADIQVLYAPNGDFEVGTSGAAPTGWTGPGGSPLTKDATANRFNTGSWSGKFVAAGAASWTCTFVADITLVGTVTVNASCAVWASAATIARIGFTGAAAGAHVSSSHTGGSTFETLTLSSSGTAGVSSLIVDMIGAGTAWFDTFKLYPNGISSLIKFITFNGKLLLITNRSIHEWDDTNKYWLPKVFTAADITDAEVFTVSTTTYLFVAQGATAYFYLTTAYAATVSTLAAPGQNATYFKRVGNTLWKSYTDNLVYSATDPLNTSGSWSSAYTVGTLDKSITGLYNYDNVPAVGKQEGLFYLSGSAFVDAAPDFANVPSSQNFATGFVYRGLLYLTVRGGRLLRWDGAVLAEVLEFSAAPQFTDFGGKVFDMTSDGGTLYYAQDSPTASVTYLMGFRESIVAEGTDLQRSSHTIRKLTTGDYSRLAYFADQLMLGSYVSATSVLTNYLALPTTSQSMARDTSPNLVTSSQLITPWWDAGFPDVTKAFLYVTVFGANLSANITLRVEFQLDAVGDGDSWTLLGNLASSGASAYFSGVAAASRNGKRIRFRLTGSSNVSTSGPEIYAVVLHSTLRPSLAKTYEATVASGVGVLTATGQSFEGISFVVDTLRSLKTTSNPMTIAYKHGQNGKQYTDTVHVLGVTEAYDNIADAEAPVTLQVTFASVVTA